jgi:hypothetical protein
VYTHSGLYQNYLPGTVGVVDGILGDLVNVEFLHIDGTGSRAGGNDGWEGALGNNGNTGTLGVLLGELSELLGNLSDVLGAPLVALRVGNGLSLVAEGVVSVWKNTVQLLLEELGDEGGGKRQHEDLEDTCIRMRPDTPHGTT